MKAFLFAIIVVLGAVLSLQVASFSWATPEYAAKTGLSCDVCHVNADQGGALTARGEGFKASGYSLESEGESGSFRLIVRFVAGFIHVITAVVWFGAIVYIHLFIKPRSLTRGLPRGEMILGWSSIVLLAVTGMVLTLFRVHSLREFWTTTFGIVWTVKVCAFVLMVAVAAVVTTRINRRMREAAADRAADPLAAFDGRQGRGAKIAYNGAFYDVSASKMWKGGMHMGRHQAGGDLTGEMEKAPHGPEVLQRVEQLGPAPQARAATERLPHAAKAFMVMAYGNLGLIALILCCVAYWNWGPPLVGVSAAAVSGGQEAAVAVASVPENSRQCVDCHRKEKVLPLQIEEWGQSAHADAGVGCLACHRAADGEADAYDHYGALISTIVSPRDCARCHRKDADQFEASRHAEGGHILASLDNYLGEIVEGVPAGISGCQQCHGSTIKTLENGRLAPESWPNTGIGRINPDGSKGSCSACHPRHRFSSAVARRPENCGRCHLGPDHPQFEIYRESKHGIAFVEAEDRMNLRAKQWRLGEQYTAAPTCVTCHNGATRDAEFTHDVGVRIAWTLRPAVSTRLDQWEKRRDRMKSTCLHCHSPGWVNNFFSQYDNVVLLYNEKFAKPATAIMGKLRESGKITGTPFDEKIEWTYFLLWHHEGRRARHGAAMMGPDYVQWHGFFEVAERFYMEFVPQAEHLLPGVTAPFLEAPEHMWLKGLPDKVRKDIENFYRERYRESSGK